MVKSKVEKYWDQKDFTKSSLWTLVDLLAQEKIYNLLTNSIPLPNLKLITEPYQFEDKQNKLTGLFLDKDADYRTLLADMESNYAEQEELPNAEASAEEIAVVYFHLVFKSLLSSLSDYCGYDPSYFSSENLN